MRKKPKEFIEDILKMKHAGIKDSPEVNKPHHQEAIDALPTLDERIQKILGIMDNNQKKYGYMLFMVMYDITSNKVRRNVVKYLERLGCMRIQKSIFLADLPSEKYREIKEDLTAIQQMYENEDSIIICPLSKDHLKNMNVIGKNIAVDIITQSKNTLFF